jgi:plasmid maintenance system antidote protein VapI
MQGKLRQLMKSEGINSTRLAEILGIQASGISHIMSGRNKPSFDFLLKLLGRFPQINPDWLLLDKGPMYRDEIKQKSAAGNSIGPRGTQSVINPIDTGDLGSSRSVGIIAESSGAAGILDDTRASEGLFGPDNTDIISASGYSAMLPNQPLDLQQRVQQMQQGRQHSQRQNQRQAAQQTMQPAVYQGGFTRSASIERIVVFYKDKTFSEYQPE